MSLKKVSLFMLVLIVALSACAPIPSEMTSKSTVAVDWPISEAYTAIKDVSSSFQCDLNPDNFLSASMHITGFSVFEKTNHMGDPLPRWNRWWEGLESNQYEVDSLIFSSGHCYYSPESLGVFSITIVSVDGSNSSISDEILSFSDLQDYYDDVDAEAWGNLYEIRGKWYLGDRGVSKTQVSNAVFGR